MNHGWVPILPTPVFHVAICDEIINRFNVWVSNKIKLTRLVHINSLIPPIIKLPSFPNHSWHLEIVSGVDSSGVTRWCGMKWHMDTLEGLDDDVFNVLPIFICYPFHYFLCVLSGNNRIEEVFRLCFIRRVFFCGVTSPQYPQVTYPSCTSLYIQIHSHQSNSLSDTHWSNFTMLSVGVHGIFLSHPPPLLPP